MKQSGRFSHIQWDREAVVKVITLDDLILTYGVPAFCKIDVEGYEASVIKGLSKPIPALSFEYTSEYFEGTQRVIEHLESLAPYEYNFSLGESMRLTFQNWLDSGDIQAKLASYSNTLIFGDVYARIKSKGSYGLPARHS